METENKEIFAMSLNLTLFLSTLINLFIMVKAFQSTVNITFYNFQSLFLFYILYTGNEN